MQVDLLRTRTADGLSLEGALQTCSQPSRKQVVVCLPGVSATFYGSSFLEQITPELLRTGHDVLWANSRGHDLVFTGYLPSGPRRFGAAYEIVDECRLDVAAWMRELGQRGYERVSLLGHSLGAIKSLYAAAKEAELRPSQVIAISPPRLHYSTFKAAGIPAFEEAIAAAEQAVAAGRGEELLEVNFPFPLLITAASYVDKYGRGERYDILKFAGRLPCPALFVYGGKELTAGSPAFAQLDQLVSEHTREAQSRVDVQVVPAADHFYSGVREQLAERLATWLGGRSSEQ